MERLGLGYEDLQALNPGLITKSFWERVLQPVLGGLLMMRFPPAKVGKTAPAQSVPPLEPAST